MKKLIVAALAIAIASPAFADKPDKNKSKGKEKASPAQTTSKSSAQATVTLHFGDREREAYRTYYTQQYGKGCPPGLAKKNNGCLPPGQAKKRYQIGQPLPHGIVILEPPREVVVFLGPPPSGYRYGVVDGDLVKLAIGSLLVVDALNGLL
jgi:Ni/Co efflux regulator RcnB